MSKGLFGVFGEKRGKTLPNYIQTQLNENYSGRRQLQLS